MMCLALKRIRRSSKMKGLTLIFLLVFSMFGSAAYAMPDRTMAADTLAAGDSLTENEIMKLLEEINRRGTTVIVVTHSRELVNMMKKRVITMDKGVVISDVREGGYRYEN